MDYIVTQITPDSWDVYNESSEIRYRVDKAYYKFTCNCPHYHFRLRGSGSHCKHIEMVKEVVKCLSVMPVEEQLGLMRSVSK